MGVAGDLLSIGASGLLTSQRALATVGQNVANVNTPGYSRQRVEQVARAPQDIGTGFLGTGVEIGSVRRVYDGFLVNQIRSSTASHSEVSRFHELAAQVDNLLADPEAGLPPVVEGFFASLHDLADDPTSGAARQMVLSNADTLSERFHALDRRLSDMRDAVNTDITDLVGEINSFAVQIADYNEQIIVRQSASGGRPPNDLLDQRDELVRKMAERIDLTAFQQDDGSINVTVGNGQALVTGTTLTPLSVVASVTEPGRLEVGQPSGAGAEISNFISGGELGGVLRFREQVLDTSQNALGRVAIAITRTVNDQHRLGMDMNGLPGGALFADIDASAPEIFSNRFNTGAPPATISVAVTDVSALSASDYRMDYDGTNYTLTRLDDGASFNFADFPGAPETVEGLTFTLTGGSIAAGDNFLVVPTRAASRAVRSVVADVNAIAAAAPVRASGSLSNVGSVQISPPVVNAPGNTVAITFNNPPTDFDVVDQTTGATLAAGVPYAGPSQTVSYNGWSADIGGGGPVAGDSYLISNTATSASTTGGMGITTATVSAPDPNLRDPVTITFNNPPTSFNVTGATTGAPTTNVPFTSGAPISFNGWTVTLDGVPVAGDSFSVGPNNGGVGDNRNAVLMAGLQTTGILGGGAATYEDAYGQMIAQVATSTRQADINQAAQRSLLNQVEDSRESVSGVNLDDEAADLLRYQQAYQASAQIISAADAMFQSLLGAVRR